MNMKLKASLACVITALAAHSQAAPITPNHGAVEAPIARQYACFQAGDFHWPLDGSDIKSPGCRAAYEHVYKKYDNSAPQATYQFVQWHEVSKNVADFNNMEAVKKAIPDGQLCSAGNDPAPAQVKTALARIKDVVLKLVGVDVAVLINDKSGLDQPAAWDAMDLAKGADNKADFRFKIQAPHNPSFWQFYVSKPDYDPTKHPLKWSDLELVDEIGNVTPNGGYYEMKVDLKDAIGRRVIYTRWQRDDPAGEGFYNCSDVNIVSNK